MTRSTSYNKKVAGAENVEAAGLKLEKVIKRIQEMTERTSSLQASLNSSISGRTSGSGFSNNDLLNGIFAGKQNSKLVEVYHNKAEAEAAHAAAAADGTVALGLDVNTLVSHKNPRSVCSTIRLKVWTRFCEPCVEDVIEERDNPKKQGRNLAEAENQDIEHTFQEPEGTSLEGFTFHEAENLNAFNLENYPTMGPLE